jgi:pimeloyl-ACP methyl ester carboxylesterase
MKRATVNGIELEYEVTGTGEPVLLISPVLADAFVPVVSEHVLSKRYQLIRYHRRGWVGSTHTPAPVSISDHAADAAALLAHLGFGRAHVAGHSSGAAVGAQLALDHPDVVHSLALLELSLLSVPAGAAFFEQAGPAFEAYAAGDAETACATFMTVVSGLDWQACAALLDGRVPGMVAQAVKDGDTFFGIELPSLGAWEFAAAQAAAITCPVLSVLGSATQPLWVEVAAFLRSSLPNVAECTIDGAGHLLQLQSPKPVARELAQFFAHHPIPN